MTAGWGSRGARAAATVFCGISSSRTRSEARFELRSSTRLGGFFVYPQHCAGEKSRPDKHRIFSKSRLGGEFLNNPKLPNTLILAASTQLQASNDHGHGACVRWTMWMSQGRQHYRNKEIRRRPIALGVAMFCRRRSIRRGLPSA
jgi:hypothetical protein